MKKNVLVFGLLAGFIFLSACGDDEPSVDLLIGEWVLEDITISDPPTGFGFGIIATTPDATILAERSYKITFEDDFTYEREIEESEVFEQDLEDSGTWERNENEIDLDQDETDIDGLPTRFTIVDLDDDKLTVVTEDLWFAFPPEIINDPVAIDTLIQEEFRLFGNTYAELVTATFEMTFERD